MYMERVTIKVSKSNVTLYYTVIDHVHNRVMIYTSSLGLASEIKRELQNLTDSELAQQTVRVE
jgi:hypothetical protein